MGKFLMTFDVVSVSRKEIVLTGESNLLFSISNPSKEWQKVAKKNNIVAVEINEVLEKQGKKFPIIAIDVISFNNLDSFF